LAPSGVKRRDVYRTQFGPLDRERVLDDRLLAARREGRNAPAIAAHLRDKMVAAGHARLDDVDIAVGAVAPRAGVSQPLALAVPLRTVVAALAVGQQSESTGFQRVELEELAAPHVLGDDQRVAAMRGVAAACDRFFLEADLGAVAAGPGDLVQLDRIAEARCDQKAARKRIPPLDCCAARFEIRRGCVPHSNRHRRHPIERQRRGRSDHLRRGSGCGERGEHGEHGGYEPGSDHGASCGYAMVGRPVLV